MSPANKQPASLTTTLVLFNTLALLLVAMWFRCPALDAIPGINGDEAWYGVQAWELLHGGRPSLHTPTGNLLNPFFCGPLLLLQACFPPSIVVLRAVSLLSGLLALAVNWWLCRWVFDHRTALVSTLGLAVLPIDIAYSRFAWDASQSLLATLPVLYLSLAAVRFPARHERLTALAILALVVAVVVHPTNILAGAAIAAALAMRWRQLRASPRSLLLVVLALLALVIWKTCLIKAPAMDFAQRVEQLHELASPARWSRAAILYGQLFSGETIYQYIPGTHSWLDWPALGGQGPWAIGTLLPWAVLLAAAWGLWRTAVRVPAEAGKGDSPAFVGRKLGQSRDENWDSPRMVLRCLRPIAPWWRPGCCNWPVSCSWPAPAPWSLGKNATPSVCSRRRSCWRPGRRPSCQCGRGAGNG